ncbi:hypothetical protein CXG81DRAFT_29101 [Caulochytrium protostelioides]|uniref:Phosphatidate cytidylyltransferase n=1 Tax=Caulochytrium protostelioides TaxID=1555241 RepID=A0A4P9XF29_9FUNG|nr:hypothetical protein CXG81DRAFT_29101 [Caulochytrium protostelioides]|eukprot:RKP04175.1 hypothetical protein CXG81DRAFT_29101 [Caulochytrium protostelioides]
MIGGFAGIIYTGPPAVVALVVALQLGVYKELIHLGIQTHEKKSGEALPTVSGLHWWFLVATQYFLYGQTIIHYFKDRILVDAYLLPLATHHRFIAMSLYLAGFVAFVMSLRPGHYRSQFGQFAWTHMVLLLVVCQSHGVIRNTFEGLIWVVLPASLVICNDIMAYVCGFFFGRTPLIQLSPKKTWEGFIGALFFTCIFGFFLAGQLARSPFMICSVRDIDRTTGSLLFLKAYQSGATQLCQPNPVYLFRAAVLPPVVSTFIRQATLGHVALQSIQVAPIQYHSLVLALFASLIAPFGGFFASGYKRAFHIKDFGASIPGHGGLTDRMDCQFMMGLFSYMYNHSFIRTVAIVSVNTVLEGAVRGLSAPQLLELYQSLGTYLKNRGLLPPASVAAR